MSNPSRLELIYKDLEKEHRRILTLVERLRAHDAITGLRPLLDQLRTLLIVHFAREQLPDGFYAALGERAHSRRDEIQVLTNDHGAILAALNTLLGDVKEAAPDSQAELLDRVKRLIEQLYDHEQREHRFATEAPEDR